MSNYHLCDTYCESL